MPDLSRENLGLKSQNTPPDQNQNQDMPDISSELDLAQLKQGQRFLARFINDPTGDTGRQAKENMKDLLAGRISRHGLSPDYWNTWADTRPPIAVYEGKGKYRLTE